VQALNVQFEADLLSCRREYSILLGNCSGGHYSSLVMSFR